MQSTENIEYRRLKDFGNCCLARSWNDHIIMVETRRSKRNNKATLGSNLPVVELISKRKRRKINDGIDQETPASKFMSIVSDDLLLQIFLRLPHARDVIRCSAVNKHWHSLIANQQFTHDFIQHHNHERSSSSDQSSPSSSPPYTLLFNCAVSRKCDNIRRPFYAHFSEKSETLHGLEKASLPSSSTSRTSSEHYLNFFHSEYPDRRVTVKASFGDLLLVTLDDHKVAQYICNPLTKQSLALPLLSTRAKANGLVCHPNQSFNHIKYKVVRIIDYFAHSFYTHVFCSETGKWHSLMLWIPRTVPKLRLPYSSSLSAQGIANNYGTLHWLLYGDIGVYIEGILAINPFKDISTTPRCRFIGLPNKFRRGHCAAEKKVCLGAVKGRLRLSQLIKLKIGFLLLVWELKDASKEEEVSWRLVHEVRLRRQAENSKMRLLSFHPNNGDMIFVLCGHNNKICKYKIGEDKYERVGEFPNGHHESLDYKDEWFHFLLRVFTLLHPSWPTTIPTLPSSRKYP